MVKAAAKPKKRFWGLKGTIHGIQFESGFEKRFIKICRQLGIKLERSKARVAYSDGAKWHTYYPDFYWPTVKFTVEIKGSWAFKENHGFVREKYAAAMVSLQGRYTLITEKELTSDFVIRLYRQLLLSQ